MYRHVCTSLLAIWQCPPTHPLLRGDHSPNSLADLQISRALPEPSCNGSAVANHLARCGMPCRIFLCILNIFTLFFVSRCYIVAWQDGAQVAPLEFRVQAPNCSLITCLYRPASTLLKLPQACYQRAEPQHHPLQHQLYLPCLERACRPSHHLQCKMTCVTLWCRQSKVCKTGYLHDYTALPRRCLTNNGSTYTLQDVSQKGHMIHVQVSHWECSVTFGRSALLAGGLHIRNGLLLGGGVSVCMR